MHKRAGMVRRFFFIALITVSLVTLGLFVASYVLFHQAYEDSVAGSARQITDVGERLLKEYSAGAMTSDELRDALNPKFHNRGFLLLADAQGEIIAYTQTGVPYFAANDASKLLDSLRSDTIPGGAFVTHSGNTVYLSGKKSQYGYIIAAVAMEAGTLTSFRLRLSIFTIVILICMLLPSVLLFRREAKPAYLLTEAASRLINGEQFLLPENLGGEMNEIASAFNTMTRRIAAAFSRLRHEKDSMDRILSSLKECVYALDADGNVLYENEAARAMLADRASEASVRINEALRAVLASGDEPADDIIARVPQGDTVLEYIVTKLANEDGRLRGAAAMIRNVTEEERLERTRHDYVANISHELRTPLSSIRGLGEGLRDGLVSDPAEQQKCFNIITDEATRLSRLVNDLLELSGLQSSVTAFETEKIDPKEVVYDLADRNDSLYVQAGITLRYAVPEEDIPCVRFNEDRLFEVLTIFLDNARKYTPAGGKTEIGAAPLETGVRFYVKDNGIGMDEDTQKRVFDRFTQADPSHGGKGSGLGLAIAREILQKTGIPIELTSAPGKGSTFSFVLPYDGESASFHA